MTGTEAIAAERQRQIDKGYTIEHDAGHGIRHLVRAAKAYLDGEKYHLPWPAPDDWWDLTHRERLVTAGALIAAAIDVMDPAPAVCDKTMNPGDHVFHDCSCGHAMVMHGALPGEDRSGCVLCFLLVEGPVLDG